MLSEIIISKIVNELPSMAAMHARTSNIYKLLDQINESAILQSKLGYPNKLARLRIDNIGEICFPYVGMGAINTLHLFALDELIIFAYYLVSRKKYKHVADMGANLGLHSIIMAKCGFMVDAYEPDPKHYEILLSNLRLNDCEDRVSLVKVAVSDFDGKASFVRVLGNTTSSHLEGLKMPYGELEYLDVDVVRANQLFGKYDLIKMDVEGSEAKIILSTDSSNWDGCDAILEVGNPEAAKLIFDHLKIIGVNCFAQRLGWKQVTSISEMPTSYRDGSLFVTASNKMHWE